MQNKTSIFIARQNDCKLLKLMYVGKSGRMEIRFCHFKRVPDLGSLGCSFWVTASTNVA